MKALLALLLTVGIRLALRPAEEPRFLAVTGPPRTRRLGGGARADRIDRFPASAVGVARGALRVLVLLTRAPEFRRVPTGRAAAGAAGAEDRPAFTSVRRVGASASGAARRLETVLPEYARRLAGSGGASSERTRPPRIRFADLAFALLALVTCAMFLLFVALLLSA